MTDYQLDWNTYKALARNAIAEGAVLLKNEDETLPITPGTTLSVFGTNQFNYYKSGTGSGGMVNVQYVVSPLDALKKCPDIELNEVLLTIYEEWMEAHPFDKGEGWAAEPWSQEEMPISHLIVAEAANHSDMALIMIGRTAGEDRDNTADPGSFLLTEIEREMISKVSKAFRKTAVIINSGNIIDMQWSLSAEATPSAILYTWQGGMEGGNGLLDILTGRVSPSGKLPDTIARTIDDYPSTVNFGHEDHAIYQEDIYVGYRYFETFAKEKVLYPFGFGLSYTSFKVNVIDSKERDGKILFSVNIKNTGAFSGKEVVQVYVEKPQGKLGNPSRSLVAFDKTSLLEPGEQQVLEFSVSIDEFSCYDDSGLTGYKSCYVLEAGLYRLYAGTDVRSARVFFDYQLNALKMVKTLSENMAPVTEFNRMKPVSTETGFSVSYEKVPLRTVNLMKRYLTERPKKRDFIGDSGYKLKDVYNKKVSLELFLDQLSNEDLACMVRGEGMCSPKVTPGTAGAFGGVTDKLVGFGIPAACCADGPSGIRMDSGTKAFSLPNGTLLASTFNLPLMEDLYEMEGLEMRKNRVDTLLGPGINIHRNPLNGRNFEYFSEDPHLTGKMAVAQLSGMHRVGVTGTLKHFSANNQEFHRHDVNSIVSERALREIYLKGFEMAVKEAGAYSIMTTYGAINGIWTAGLYDQNTRILREEWDFNGIVMTDWWAKMNNEGEPPAKNNTAQMIRSQNDLYMVVSDSSKNPFEDNTFPSLEEGTLTREELLRSAENICHFILRSPVMERVLGLSDGLVDVIGLDETEDGVFDFDVAYQPVSDGDCISLEAIDTSTGTDYLFAVALEQQGMYELSLTVRSEASELAQIPVTLIQNNVPSTTFSFNGTGGEWVTQTREVFFFNKHAYLKLHFGLGGLETKDIQFKLLHVFSMKDA